MEVDCTQFGHLLENYKNNFTPGLDRYPKTHTDAYNEKDPESERTSQLSFEFALHKHKKRTSNQKKMDQACNERQSQVCFPTKEENDDETRE